MKPGYDKLMKLSENGEPSAIDPSDPQSSPASPCSPDEVIAFLLGEGPLDGVWFGEKHPTERGNFWWRKYLRPNAKAQAPKPAP